VEVRVKQIVAAVWLLAATAAVTAGGQQQNPPQTPDQQQQRPPQTTEQQRQIPTVPPLSEDRRVKAEEIDTVMSQDDTIIVDVREPKEIEELGGYEGAINIPLPQLEKRLSELPKDKTILTT
jgi:hypothetical protein